jgi:uncharacterized protein HemX
VSRIIDSLKRATNQKYSAKYSQATVKNGSAQPESSVILSAQGSQTENPVESVGKFQPAIANASTKTALIIGLVITASCLLLLGGSLGFAAMSKSYAKANTNTATKLGRLEELLNKNNQQLAAFSNRIKEQESEIKKLSQQTKESQNLISLMEKNNNAQRTSIENLTKAKNSLYKKIEDLYKEIDTLKGSGSIAGKPPAP